MGRIKKFGVRQEKKKKEDFLITLEKKLGIISTSLKENGIPYSYYKKWMIDDADFRIKVDEVNEKSIDFVESKLYNLINEGDRTAIIFYLKCKGKHRGYVEKAEVIHDVNINEKFKINVIQPKELIEGKDFEKKYLNE